MRLVVSWLVTLLVLWTPVFCTLYTLRAWTDDWPLFLLLLPSCLFVWACVALILTGLLAHTEGHVQRQQGGPTMRL